jgi:hypothetical protein
MTNVITVLHCNVKSGMANHPLMVPNGREYLANDWQLDENAQAGLIFSRSSASTPGQPPHLKSCS